MLKLFATSGGGGRRRKSNLAIKLFMLSRQGDQSGLGFLPSSERLIFNKMDNPLSLMEDLCGAFQRVKTAA